jgi:hypothetical protein
MEKPYDGDLLWNNLDTSNNDDKDEYNLVAYTLPCRLRGKPSVMKAGKPMVHYVQILSKGSRFEGHEQDGEHALPGGVLLDGLISFPPRRAVGFGGF